MRWMYNTRVSIQRLGLDMTNGVPKQEWQQIDTIVDPYLGVPGEMMCRIDLQYQRPGKDLPMPVVAGRAPDRIGLMFFDPTEEVQTGDRFECISGPIQGTFEIRVIPDPAQAYSLAHHMEVQIVEVAQKHQSNLLDPVEVVP